MALSYATLGPAQLMELDPPAHSETLQRVLELAPELTRQTTSIERDQAVSGETLSLLREAGCLRMTVAGEHGGSELSLIEVLAVIEALSRADGTLAWLTGQVALSHVVFSYLSDDALLDIYADGPDVFAAGAAAPRGRATAVSGGWQVSGRWPLVSGCRHAAWFYVQCLVAEPDRDDADGAANGEANGEATRDRIPRMRTIVVPAAEPQIIGHWRGLGLRGSGSDDIQLRACLCPDSRSCDLNRDAPGTTASNRVSVATQAGLVAAAVLTGAAQAALETVTALASAKRPSFSSVRLADQPLFQDRLGEGWATLLAARSLLFATLGTWDPPRAADAPVPRASADTGDADPDTLLRAAGTKSAALAQAAIETAYDLGGSSSVADVSPLQRRLRDARSLSQHAAIAPELLRRLGALAVAGDGSDHR